MLVDDVTITIKAGDGGRGFVHFFRAGHNPNGGPDGGNGGKGGDVYISATHNRSDLSEFSHKKKVAAADGDDGREKNMHGRNGEDVTIYVPLGTTIHDLTRDKTVELMHDDRPFLIARGGKGGRGNTEFKSSTNQTPQNFEWGDEGEVKEIHFVLKLIAQVGFIGLPNAGKSSLLATLTRANPKIANYPFTTLEPNLGVMFTGEEKQPLILADIPGLIEGAHTGKGLGIKFLQHIEKTELLVHCIDITDPDPLKTYHIVREEFENYNNGILLEKPEVIVLTKTDLVQTDVHDKAISKLKKMGKQIYTASIYNEESLEILKTVLKQKVQNT
jgi:GTP-binding protein